MGQVTRSEVEARLCCKSYAQQKLKLRVLVGTAGYFFFTKYFAPVSIPVLSPLHLAHCPLSQRTLHYFITTITIFKSAPKLWMYFVCNCTSNIMQNRYPKFPMTLKKITYLLYVMRGLIRLIAQWTLLIASCRKKF